MQQFQRPTTRSTARTLVVAGVVGFLTVACGGEQQVSDEALQDADAACGELLVGADAAELDEMEVTEALDTIPELSRTAAALQIPQFRDGLDSYDEVTVFAPIDSEGGQPTQDDSFEDRLDDEGLSERPSPPPGAYVYTDGALTLEELLDVGEVEVADGGTLTIDATDNAIQIVRDRDSDNEGNVATVEVICADIEVRDAVIHVLNGEPYPDQDPNPQDLGEAPEIEVDPDLEEEEELEGAT